MGPQNTWSGAAATKFTLNILLRPRQEVTTDFTDDTDSLFGLIRAISVIRGYLMFFWNSVYSVYSAVQNRSHSADDLRGTSETNSRNE